VSSYPSELDVAKSLPVVVTEVAPSNPTFSGRKTKFAKDLINEDKETIKKIFEDLDYEEKDFKD
jgi:hypothetical protein